MRNACNSAFCHILCAWPYGGGGISVCVSSSPHVICHLSGILFSPSLLSNFKLFLQIVTHFLRKPPLSGSWLARCPSHFKQVVLPCCQFSLTDLVRCFSVTQRNRLETLNPIYPRFLIKANFCRFCRAAVPKDIQVNVQLFRTVEFFCTFAIWAFKELLSTSSVLFFFAVLSKKCSL